MASYEYAMDGQRRKVFSTGKRRFMISRLVRGLIVTVLATATASRVSVSSPLSVQATTVRPRVYPTIENVIHALVRNEGQESLAIQRITFRGYPVWPSISDESAETSGVVWCQVWPTVVKPGEWSELKVLPSHGPICGATAEILYSVNGKEERLAMRGPERESSVVWKGIAFGDALSWVWIGVSTTGTQSLRLTSILLNGEDRIQDAVPKDLCIRPGQVLVTGFPLKGKILRGEDVYVVCRTENGETAAAHVRVNDQFPIWNNLEETPSWLGLDERPACLKELMNGPPGELGTDRVKSFELARLYALHRNASKSALGYLLKCKSIQEDGLAVYAPLVDAILTNPQQSLREAGEEAGTTRSYRLAEVAYRSTSPGPWYALISTAPDPIVRHGLYHIRDRAPTPGEVEHLIWESIANGAKGLCYSGSVEDLQNADIGEINQRVGKFLPGLRYAIPVESREISDRKAQLSVLQAATKELIVIVTNNTLAFIPGPGTPSTVELLPNVRVELRIPPDLQVDSRTEGYETTDEGTCSFTIPRLRYVDVRRVTLRRTDPGPGHARTEK